MIKITSEISASEDSICVLSYNCLLFDYCGVTDTGIGGASSLFTNGNKRPMTDQMRMTTDEQAEKISDAKRNKHSGGRLIMHRVLDSDLYALEFEMLFIY